ncbi:MAG: uncharacterized protein K0S45_2620 [Nitrospira sp.]|jgi:hypothetical protein|nr:uncharacterized protein [Nitrospira sp.]
MVGQHVSRWMAGSRSLNKDASKNITRALSGISMRDLPDAGELSRIEGCGWTCFTVVLILVVATTAVSWAENRLSGAIQIRDRSEWQGPEFPDILRGGADGIAIAPAVAKPQEADSSEFPDVEPPWRSETNKSYLIPGAEILAYLFLLNQYDRHFTEPKDAYRTNGNTLWQHLTDSKWVIDNDQFSINQFLHPYGGTVYYGLARSTGLNAYESFLYSAAGSFLWEVGGETTNPSINDQITTTFGGAFLGEPLFRMANLLLESEGERPGLLRELGAAIISPPTGFNRLLFGNRFDALFPSRDPATFLRVQVGGTLTSSSRNVSESVREGGVAADFAFSYGLPGKPGYTYDRPFDYFDFHLAAASANTVESINTRGLIVGAKYGAGDSTRGIWGLYGSYDYIAPQVFRVSTTALSLGTTWQTWLGHSVALQGTMLGGVGYGAAGSIHRTEDRDYHYGTTPQALLSLRLIFADRAMIDVTGREYHVSDIGSPERHGRENILRGDASFTLRVFDRHGIAVRYAASHRDASYPSVEFRNQTVSTVSLMYVLLGNTGFGAVEWR